MDAAGSFSEVAPALARAGHRVLAADMRGFGEGPRVPRGGYYHFVDYVFDVADIVDALCPGEVIGLVGHSMGGTIATYYAGTFPERVSRLVSLEGLGPPDQPFEIGPIRMRSWIDQVRSLRARGEERGTMTLREASARLAVNHPGVPDPVLEKRLEVLVAPAEGGGEGGRVAWRNDPLHRTTAPVPFFAKLFVEFAKKVACPVLYVSGGPKGYHPPDEAERVSAFPRSRRVEIADAGHMMHWTKPEALTAILLDFIDGQHDGGLALPSTIP
jgi:pimeloyl-ACP methyl ester carboxylesterase